MSETPPGSAPGPGVDATGSPVLDPTRNVLDLVDAAIKRQDDLRMAEFRRQDELRVQESQHHKEIADLRWRYDTELRAKETERIDSIRAVDVAAVQRAAEVQQTQAGALAAQVVATADAFRVSLAAALEPIIKDIADLRKTQYEQAGQRTQVGESRLNYGAIIAGFGFLLALATLVIVMSR